MSIPTPHETTGQRTTLAQEDQFFADLAAASGRFAVESLGSSVQGRPMRLVRIGAPSAPPAPVDGVPDSLLLTASIHGNEYMAREAALELIRDLVFSTDPALVAYLTAHPIYVMPTCNPDRVPAPLRPNMNGIDLNRDHFALTQPENRAVWTAIRRVRPSLLLDMHEYAAPRTSHLAPIPASHPQIGEPARFISAQLNERVKGAVVASGRTAGVYDFASTTLPTMLVNAFSLVTGAAALTPETSTFEPEADRLAIHRIVARETIEYHRVNAASIKAHNAASRQGLTGRGASGLHPYALMDGPAVLYPAPFAYRLTDEQHEMLAPQRDLFSLATTPDVVDGGWRMSLAQPGMGIIPLLLDGQSPYAVTVGKRVPVKEAPGVEPVSWGPIKIDGIECPVTSVSMFDGVAMRRVWP